MPGHSGPATIRPSSVVRERWKQHELVAAGMLILAGGSCGFPLDYGELERWTRIGFERGMRSLKGER
jgi:hypothetical protein